MEEKKLYQVGGCVRDKLLGIENSDIDWLAVGYSEEDFKDYEKIGKDFPVFLNKNNEEIALARRERKNGHGYNDFTSDILNVSLNEDLSRRDLTINSIAYDVQNDILIDPFDGIKDIKQKILKHTTIAFKEDPLRVLRLARFQTKFKDFTIDNSTTELVLSMKNELKYLQKDRVYKEIKKVFLLDDFYIFFQTLLELDVLEELFPIIYKLVLNNKFKKIISLLSKTSKYSDTVKYTILYIDCYTNQFDINLPIKLQKKVKFLIKNKNILSNIYNLNIEEIVEFFESFKKDIILFNEQIKVDIIYNKNKNINKELLNNIFNKILDYSPLEWINKQTNTPNGNDIKDHIHKVNLEIIRYNFTYV